MKIDIWHWLGALWVAGLAYLMQIPQPIQALIMMMFIINLPLGYIGMVFTHKLSRTQFVETGLTKLASLFFLAACHIMEPALGTDFHIEQKVAYLFLGHEFLCTFRYASACGVQLPSWISDLVDRLVAGTERPQATEKAQE